MDSAVDEAVFDNGGERDTAISIDGTWRKHVHTGLNGVVSITSVDTGKAIDVSPFQSFVNVLIKPSI